MRGDPRQREGGMGAFYGSPQKSSSSTAQVERDLPSPPPPAPPAPPGHGHSGEPGGNSFRGSPDIGSWPGGSPDYGAPPPKVELWPEAVGSGRGGYSEQSYPPPHSSSHHSHGSAEQYEDRGGAPPPPPQPPGYTTASHAAIPDAGSVGGGFFGLGSFPTPGSFIGLRPPTLQQPPLQGPGGAPMQTAPMPGSFQFGGGTGHYPGAVGPYGAPPGGMPQAGSMLGAPAGTAYASTPYPGQMGRAH